MRYLRILLVAAAIVVSADFEAKAQMATVDMTNFYQSLMSYLQDSDNIAENTVRFLENMGILEEQLDNLKKWNERYSKISSALYKGQTVVRVASNYEMTIRMFSRYVTRMKSLGDDVSYFKVRNAVNEGFQYLLLASREVKKVRELLDKGTDMSEEKRREGLEQCDARMCRLNVLMHKHILDVYSSIDTARILKTNLQSLDSAFKLI